MRKFTPQSFTESNQMKIENLEAYCFDVAQRAKLASAALASVTGKQKNDWLNLSAGILRERMAEILAANEKDLEAAPGYGLTPAEIDRLKLDPQRVEDIAQALEYVAKLPDPVGEVISSQVRPNGLDVQKVRVPLGVVFFIYESRPNVTADAAALCVKSSNAVILRGGKEAIHSSMKIAELLSETAEKAGIPRDAVQLVATTDHDAVGHFLKMNQFIDVTIPRGGEGLIRRVTNEATMPVIKHFAGNCHVYVDAAAEEAKTLDIVINSKCQRMGVCNAAESLVVHRAVVETLLPKIAEALKERGVEIRGDEPTCAAIPFAVTASDADFYTEYHGPVISCKIVDSLDEAIRHINQCSSGHTEAICTNDLAAAREFALRIDSSAVMINASTRFNDGGEFGLGAEIGISTDKFHARGPCGLRELTSYKYIVYGDGQTRG
ncbi:MAG: glutamate-5-semialdehyde dehydrogenase [Thermoguttaceae bacterium]|nr:glutamate-5-semialdehyde dehydrogenase [Thermoguttaceae bacterium]